MSKEVMAQLIGVEWMPGHVVNGVLMKFYHLCPGQGCAIGNYLQRLADRQLFAELDEDEKSPGIGEVKACE